jgi:pimeloyl-ACP methyl ester carboxylesterase
VNTSDISSIYHALDIRMNDVSFVLDTLGLTYDIGTPKAVMFGHSFGGATTAAAMMNDTRLRGGVNLDRLLFGGVINAGLGRPYINQ